MGEFLPEILEAAGDGDVVAVGEAVGEEVGSVAAEVIGEWAGSLVAEVEGDAAAAGEEITATGGDLTQMRRILSGNSSSSRLRAGKSSGFRARVYVKVDTSGFARFRKKIDSAVITALAKTGRDVANRAKSNETRMLSGRLKHSIEVSPVYRTKRGFAVDVYSTDKNALWQERGTSARRGRAKTKRTRDKRLAAGISRGGVKPLRFFLRATKGSPAELVDEIRSAMR